MERIKRLIVVVLLLFFASCGAQKNLPPAEITQKDSVTVVVKKVVEYRDSLIYVEVPVEVEKVIMAATDTSHLETSLAVSEAWVTDGKLNHTIAHKKTKIEKEIVIPETHTETITEKVESSERVEYVEVEAELSSWQNFLIVFGKIAMAAVALLVIIVSLKRFI